MKRKQLLVLALVVGLIFSFGPIKPLEAAVTIFEYNCGISPFFITRGPDGNLWFDWYDGAIGKITTSGKVTSFSAGIDGGSDSPNITTGPDGNIWFTEYSGSRIGRITLAGDVTYFSAGITPRSFPNAITSGPDGNIWFAERGGNRIGRITPAGVVTEFSKGITAQSDPEGITTGPDGNLWFAEYNGNKIGRITPAGDITEYPTSGSPVNITSGPDGNLWFTEPFDDKIGKITPAGVVTEFAVTVGNIPYDITLGPDGNLWFTEPHVGRVAMITPTGDITEFSSGITLGSGPYGITTGPDGNIWFTEYTGGRIGRISLSSSAPTAAAGDNISLDREDMERMTSMIIHGTAPDQNVSGTLTYRWVEGQTALLDWTPVDQKGDCPLDLAKLSFQDGLHTLILEVTDSQSTATSAMTLTIANSSFLVLHSFAGGTDDGAGPLDNLISMGGIFYGTTMKGGTFNKGSIFKFDPSSRSWMVLHSFAGGITDGDGPTGALTLVGTTLFGMTSSGGAHDNGAIFKYDTKAAGDGFKLLYSLGASGEGTNPRGFLTRLGETLYGMTSAGGANSKGTIFKYNANSAKLVVLHSFTGAASDGGSPQGSLTLLGATLYGMTEHGGSHDAGIIFSYNTTAKVDGFKLLYNFSSTDTSNGASPLGSLTSAGTTLYGMTHGGGANDNGTIFKYDTKSASNGFTLLHSFDSTNGANPYGDLILLGATLYGMTSAGGYSGDGTIFGYDTKANGDGFTLLHTFDSTDGTIPCGSLAVLGKTLYGMTKEGGANSLGVIFSYVPDFTVSGIVKSLAGPHLENATLAFQSPSGLVATAQTDKSGAYSLADLLDGTYTLTPTLPGWKFLPPWVKVAIKDQNVIKNFTGTPVTLTGIVTLFQGRQIPSGLAVTVKLADGSGNQVSSVSTTGSGSYEFDGIAGQYTVTPFAPVTTHHPAGSLMFVPPSANIGIYGQNTKVNFKLQTGTTCKSCH